MLHPYMTMYLIKILNSFLVPSQYISVNYAEQHNTLMVLVYKPNSKDFYSVEFNPAEVSFGDKDVQEMLYQAALWYHDGIIPVRSRTTLLTWWHRQGVWEQFILLWLAGFTLIVLMAIAKHLGWYE